MKTMVRPSFSAFFLTPASAPASTAGSWLRPAPGRVPPDAGNSNPVAAECARPARHGSGPRIPPRSSAPPATPSTARSHSPELPAHASARAQSSSVPLGSVGVCVRRARLSSSPTAHRLPVVGPSDSPIAGARPPAAPPRTDGLPWPATAPPASAAAPVPENLVAPPPDFPWADDSIAIQKCHYIIQYSIGTGIAHATIATSGTLTWLGRPIRASLLR